MLVQDQVSPRGFVTLEVWQRGQRRVIDHPNLITTAGRERFPRLLGGDPTALHPSQIAIGENGAAASPGDTAITPALLLPFSAAPTYLGATVTFEATALEADGNGLWVREFGLLDPAGVLLARWVRARASDAQNGPVADLQKANDMRLIVRWAIAF